MKRGIWHRGNIIPSPFFISCHCKKNNVCFFFIIKAYLCFVLRVWNMHDSTVLYIALRVSEAAEEENLSIVLKLTRMQLAAVKELQVCKYAQLGSGLNVALLVR